MKDKETSEILLVRDLHLTRGGKEILRGINWQIMGGDHWVVLGKNGCGKSSLAKMLMGLSFSHRGDIYYLGNKTPGGNLWDIRKSLGFVSSELQNNRVPGQTGLDVVLSGFFNSNGLYENISSIHKERAHEVCQRLLLSSLAELDFELLSYGEKKKLLLARALVSDPKLIILDEPCAGLDPISRELFLDFLAEKVASLGVSIAMITHHVEEIIPIFTHLAIMEQGVFTEMSPLRGEFAQAACLKTLSQFAGKEVTYNEKSRRFYSLY